MSVFWPLFFCALLAALSGIRIAQEYERSVIFRLGRCAGTRGPGIYYLIPFIERQKKIDMRTKTVDIEQQETITKDSVTIKVNAVLWFRVQDAVNATISVEDYYAAVYQVSLTCLRNLTGQFVLDDVLKERALINAKLREMVDQMTGRWGVVVEMVEMKDVEIPTSMQRAMAREAEAFREKRARIIKADAELEAAEKLTTAAERMQRSPAALELRRMQMVAEVGAEHNSTTILMIPSDFISMARSIGDHLSKPSGAAPGPNPES
jgi:regulator of protease activity HflC (stomatin/prohibitin superfamily)